MSERSEHEEEFCRAGEYVLGLGEAAERQAMPQEIERDPVLAEAVAAWERWLTPLWAGFRPINPPPALWSRLERTVSGMHERERREGAPTSARRSDARRGRWSAGALGFALAAGIAGLLLLTRPPAPLSPPVAALLPKTAGLPIVVGERAADGSLGFRPIGTLTVPTGKDYELWSLPAGAKRPIALGLLRAGKARVAADRIAAGRSDILVSLEPSGGSPTGLPTGPVLWGGAFER